MSEAIRFYVHDDFKFEIGNERKIVIVPRMKFITGGTVIAKIADTQAKDMKTSLDIILKAKAGQDNFYEGIQGVISTLIREKNFDLIIELLAMISEGALDRNIINDANCQYDEVVKLLQHLIEGNFSSLKNLSASLQAITSPGRN